MSEEGLLACPPPLASTQSLAACGTRTGQAGIWHGHFQCLQVHLCGKQREEEMLPLIITSLYNILNNNIPTICNVALEVSFEYNQISDYYIY